MSEPARDDGSLVVAPACYCGAPTRLRSGAWGPWYACTRYPACDGGVGCHAGTTTPLGSVADRATRRARIRAHRAFDQLWRKHMMSRGDAYRFLAKRMGLEREAHIGEFDVNQCATVELVVGQYLRRRAAKQARCRTPTTGAATRPTSCSSANAGGSSRPISEGGYENH